MVTGEPTRENEQELRLALAMRGGASMAVWIGGAVAEIDRLRRSLAPAPDGRRTSESSENEPGSRSSADGTLRDSHRFDSARHPDSTRPPESAQQAERAARSEGDERRSSADQPDDQRRGRPHPWAALARLAGYDSVSVDVLAGTSAGGLNATLLTASLVYGMPFDDIRTMWVRLADLEAMSRPVPKWWQSPAASLLEGDDYLRSELVRVLTENVPSREGPPETSGAGERADLLLTATLLDPVHERHLDDRADAVTQQRRTASFRFHHEGRPGQPLSDFGSGKDFDDTALRLAHAARTTSSYPFAFEPSRVYSSEGKPPGGAPDMFGLFSEIAGSSNAPPFRVVDGGVLDNIPVTAAIEAIAAASADRPTDRWLLYLNPDPTGDVEKPPSRLALPVASAAVRARMTQESLLADIRVLDEHNESVDRTALRREALFAELRSASPTEWPMVLARKAEAVKSGHAVVRAELDAQAVHRLLARPSGTEDGKLLPPVVEDPLEGWSAPARAELLERLSAALGEQATVDADQVFDDVRGLLAGVQECLGWVRDIERWAPRSHMPEIGTCKAALYRLQTFGEVLEAHADRYWVNGARWEPIVELAELDGWVRRVMARRRRLQHRLPSPVGPLLGAVLDGVEGGPRFQRPLAEFAAELLSIVDSSGADAVPSDDEHIDAVAEGRAVLHRLVDRLAEVAPGRTHFEQPEQLAYAVLERGSPARVLRQLVVITAPLDVGRAPGSRINFLRVASNAATPLPFHASGSGTSAPRVEDKIRGSDLGNFGAFLSAKWRANDWMWGRLDAASSLLDLLISAPRLVRQNAESGPEEVTRALGTLVVEPATEELEGLDDAELQRWREFFDELWSARVDAVRAEVEAAFARPEDTHPMAVTKRTVTERLQWTIVAREIPFVSGVREGADPDFQDASRVAEPKRLRRQVQRYSVGRQRWPDLGERRTTGIAARFGMLAYSAIRPTGAGVLEWLGRWALTAVKPLLLTVAFAVAAPTRAALLAFVSVASFAVTGPGNGGSPAPGARVPSPDAAGALVGPQCPRADDIGCGVSWGSTSPPSDGGAVYAASGVPAVVTLVLAVVTAGWLGWRISGRLSRGRGLARWASALVVGAAVLAGTLWLFTVTGFRLGPGGFGLVAVVVTGLATCAYRFLGRLLSMVGTALAFVVAWLLAIWWPLGPPGFAGCLWVVVFLLLAGYAHVVLSGSVDLLKPRPRTAR